jgi:hypothetical protein
MAGLELRFELSDALRPLLMSSLCSAAADEKSATFSTDSSETLCSSFPLPAQRW